MSPENPASRISDIPNAQMSDEQRDVVTKLLSGRGRIPTPFKIWLHSPAVATHLQALGEFLTARSALTARETKIVILSMAVHWHANYVFDAHAREARTLGLADNIIDAIGSGRSPPLTDHREQLIYTLVTQLNGFDPPSDAAFDPVIRQLGHAGMADLLALCGYFTAISLATKTYRIV